MSVKRHFLSLLLLVGYSAMTLAAPADYHYTGKLVINPETGHIQADWQITVFDADETDITFFLRHTLDELQVDGPGVAAASMEKQPQPNGFWEIRVSLTEAAPERQVHFSYAGVLLPEPMENRINAIEPGRIELNVDSFWFPIDTRFSKSLSAELDMLVGNGWQGVTTGEVEPIAGGMRVIQADPRIDIAVTLSKTFNITRAEGFTIYDQRQQQEGVDKLVRAAGQCREFLDSHFGAQDSLPASKLLITSRNSSGYARQNYIVFTDVAETKAGRLTIFVCHEFGHYYARGAKFDTVDNWINESFAEYLGLMALREFFGETAYENRLEEFREQIADSELPRIWQAGDTERGSYLVMYRKGPLALARLETALGRQQFLTFLQALSAMPVKTTERLLVVLEDIAGKEQRDTFEKILGQ